MWFGITVEDHNYLVDLFESLPNLGIRLKIFAHASRIIYQIKFEHVYMFYHEQYWLFFIYISSKDPNMIHMYILFSNTNHHMSGDAQLLNDLCDVSSYLASMSNGSMIIASNMETYLTNNMKLHHIPYVPYLKYHKLMIEIFLSHIF